MNSGYNKDINIRVRDRKGRDIVLDFASAVEAGARIAIGDFEYGTPE